MDVILNATDWQMIMFFVPIIVALGEVLKSVGLDKKYLPISNIVIGIAASYAFTPSGKESITSAVLIGMITGLSASGLYSSGKTTIEVVKNTSK